MARSSAHNLCAAAGSKLVLLLFATAAAVSAAAAGGEVVTYSHPAFTAATTSDMVVATNSSVLTPAALLFERDAILPRINASEGFLVLSRPVHLWSGGSSGSEASFNTSFTVSAGGAAPVAFVVLRDGFPPFNSPGGLRGEANYSLLAGAPVPTNATAAGGLTAVEVGPVMSYGPDTPAGGLNVTVTPLGSGGGGRAVWIEHDAAAHRVSVRVAGAGESRPAAALLDVPLGGAGSLRWTTDNALVGFSAGRVGDVVGGVRDWELAVDRIPGDDKSGAASGEKKKATAWSMIVMAVLVSMAAIIV